MKHRKLPLVVSADRSRLARLPSSVAPGIPGLFLLGRARADEAICFYPGLMYPPGEMTVFFAGLRNNYFMRLSDGTYLDGRYYGLSRFLWRGASGRSGNITDSTWLNLKFRPGVWRGEEEGGDVAQVCIYVSQTSMHTVQTCSHVVIAPTHT